MGNFPNWADHIVAFIFCVLLPFSEIRQHRKNHTIVSYSSEQKRSIYFSVCISLFIMAAIVVAVWLLFGRPLSALGLVLHINGSAWVWPALIFSILYAADTILSVASPKNIAAAVDDWEKRTPFLPAQMNEFRGYLVMCLCAGVFEEIVYRGFLVTYFGQLFRGSDYRTILSVVVPALIFAVSHFYHGVKNIVKIFILSSFLGYIFIQSGSLLIVMLLHFMVNVIGGLLSMKYVKR